MAEPTWLPIPWNNCSRKNKSTHIWSFTLPLGCTLSWGKSESSFPWCHCLISSPHPTLLCIQPFICVIWVLIHIFPKQTLIFLKHNSKPSDHIPYFLSSCTWGYFKMLQYAKATYRRCLWANYSYFQSYFLCDGGGETHTHNSPLDMMVFSFSLPRNPSPSEQLVLILALL